MSGTIQWYPGHMARAERELRERAALVDVVLLLVDARIPRSSSSHPRIEAALAGRPTLLVLGKADLADPRATEAWVRWFARRGRTAVPFSARSSRSVAPLVRHVFSAVSARGGRPPRVAVVGMPNVGKSTLVNRLVGRRAVRVGRLPGVTRGIQWLRGPEGLLVLDTPGILPPRLDDQEAAQRLALLGLVREERAPREVLAAFAFSLLRGRYRDRLEARYGSFRAEDLEGPGAFYRALAGRLRFLLPGGKPDAERAMRHVLREIREGRFGPMTLEWPEEENGQEEENGHEEGGEP